MLAADMTRYMPMVTFNASMICSGAIVFLALCLHTSLASDETRWMNSESNKNKQLDWNNMKNCIIEENNDNLFVIKNTCATI